MLHQRIFILLLSIVLFFSHSQAQDFEKGFIDLSSFDFQNNSYCFQGEALFYHEAFITQKNYKTKKSQLIKIGKDWSKQPEEYTSYPKSTYGTYHLKLKLSDEKDYILQFTEAHSASKIFVNDQLLLEVGKLSNETKSEEYGVNVTPIYISREKIMNGELNIFIQVSNFHYRKGGVTYPVCLAEQELFLRQNSRKILLEEFGWVGILFASIFLFIFYFIQPKNNAFLYASLMFFMIFLRGISTGLTVILYWIPHLPGEILTKIRLITFYCTVPLALLFSRYFFPKEFTKLVFKIIIIVAFSLATFVSVVPLAIGSYTVRPFQVTALFAVIFVVIYMLKAIKKRRAGSRPIMMGISIASVGLVNDVMNHLHLIDTLFIGDICSLIFVWLIVYVLAVDSARAQNNEVKLINQLQVVNSNLEHMVEERTIELKKQSVRIQKSIQAAQTIQQAILPPEEEVLNYFKELSVLYRPKDVVSGDFYWMGQKGDHVIFAVVDCTGHGVPGAFVSMIGNSLLEKIVLADGILSPDRILTALHQQIFKLLKQENSGNMDGMDVCCISYNTRKAKEIYFSGARRPLYFQSTSNLKVKRIEGTRKGIGGKQNKNINFENIVLKVEKGDRLFLTSDGIVDQMNIDSKKFGRKNLVKFLANSASQCLTHQVQIFEEELLLYQGDAIQLDDMIMVGLEI